MRIAGPDAAMAEITGLNLVIRIPGPDSGIAEVVGSNPIEG